MVGEKRKQVNTKISSSTKTDSSTRTSSVYIAAAKDTTKLTTRAAMNVCTFVAFLTLLALLKDCEESLAVPVSALKMRPEDRNRDSTWTHQHHRSWAGGCERENVGSAAVRDSNVVPSGGDVVAATGPGVSMDLEASDNRAEASVGGHAGEVSALDGAFALRAGAKFGAGITFLGGRDVGGGRTHGTVPVLMLHLGPVSVGVPCCIQ